MSDGRFTGRHPSANCHRNPQTMSAANIFVSNSTDFISVVLPRNVFQTFKFWRSDTDSTRGTIVAVPTSGTCAPVDLTGDMGIEDAIFWMGVIQEKLATSNHSSCTIEINRAPKSVEEKGQGETGEKDQGETEEKDQGETEETNEGETE